MNRKVFNNLINYFCFFLIFCFVVQLFFGFPLRKSKNFRESRIQQRGKYAFKCKLNRKLNNARLYLDDAEQLKRVWSIKEVKEMGQGRWCIKGGSLWFSLPINTNDYKDLEIRLEYGYDLGFWNLFVILPLVFLFRRKFILKINKFFVLLLLLLGGFCAFLFRYSYFEKYSFILEDGYFYIKGMFFSDALGWSELAIAISEGRGFSGHFDAYRPFFAVFLAFFYYIFGNETAVVLFTNIFLCTLTGFFAYKYLRNELGAGASILLFFYILLLPNFIYFQHISMTEQLGFTLFFISMLCFFVALKRNDLLLFFLSGGIFIFSNLSQTLNLHILPFFLVFILIYARKKLLSMSVFLVGVLIILMPWLVRQKIKHDIWAPSISGMVLIYGSTKKEGKLGKETFIEFEKKGLDMLKPKKVYNYCKESFYDFVINNPFLYLKKFAKEYNSFLRSILSDDVFLIQNRFNFLFFSLVFGALIMVYDHNSKINLRINIFLMSSLGLFLVLLYFSNIYLLLFFILCAWGLAIKYQFKNIRILLEIVMLNFCGITFLFALIGKFSKTRFEVYTQVLLVLAIFLSFRILLKFLLNSKNFNINQEYDRGINRVSFLFIFIFCSSISIFFTIKYLFHNKTSEGFVYNRNNLSNLRLNKNQNVNLNDYDLASMVELTPYRCFIVGGENLKHWSRIFRTVEKSRYIVNFRDISEKRGEVLKLVNLYTSQHNLFKHKKYFLLAKLDPNFRNKSSEEDGEYIYEAVKLIPISVVDEKVSLDFENSIEF